MPELPAMTQHDIAYFDYVEGLKRHNYTRHVTALLDHYEERAACFREDHAYAPATIDEAGDLIKADPLYPFACGIQRASQLLMWQAGIDSLKPHRSKLRAVLEREMPARPLGKLELNPDLALPDWYTDFDIHLTPGGYWGDEIVGPIYQRTSPLYRTAWRRVTGGNNMDPGALVIFARTAPARKYRRILDLGCAFGGSTLAFRRAYPDAEVVGIDLSAAALKWAHLTAEEQGLAVTFSQRSSTDTGYERESFDLVTGYLLLHEMPPEAQDATVREAFRLLRPGGHVMFLDIPPYHALPPQVAFLEDFDTWGNGEVFWRSFLSRDFAAVLRATGFVGVEEGALDYEEPEYWGAAALMRTGKFEKYNRWVTRGDKPASGRNGAEVGS